jgi:hypothetical protein
VTTSDYYNKPTYALEHKLYDHLLYCVQTESPAQMIGRFQELFLGTKEYEDIEIWQCLDALISSKQGTEEFIHILNRCCHILINRWQMHPYTQAAIPELVGLFDHIPISAMLRSRSSRKLRDLVREFKETEQYLTLYRLSNVISQSLAAQNNSTAAETDESVGNLMLRYPYLYEHCLLNDDSSFEHKETVRNLKEQMQHKFELNLSNYVTYQVRMAQIAKMGRVTPNSRIIQPLKNPTLLTERELGGSLRHFTGTVESGRTYKELANSFISHTKYTPSYQVFKDDLYQYLTSGIDPSYGKMHFNNKLHQQLKSILPDNNNHKPNEFLQMRTCGQILNFLVVESKQKPQHFQFIDLISNTGATFTIGLLLKMVLFCRKVKPYLEKRFSILFNHYESNNKDGVPWLVQSLENLNVALSVHFGAADVSSLNHLR